MLDVRAYLLDDPRSLVPEEQGDPPAPSVRGFRDVEVGVTHASRTDRHDDLARAGGIELDVDDLERARSHEQARARRTGEGHLGSDRAGSLPAPRRSTPRPPRAPR